MNAIRSNFCAPNDHSFSGEMRLTSAFEDPVMREMLLSVRDAVVGLGMQVVFRVTILLRRWNY